MANTLTGLFPTIYAAFNVVSRERIGMIPAVSKDAQAEEVTINQVIKSPVVPKATVTDITPGNIAPSGQSENVDSVDITISKQKKASFHLTAEEEKGLASAGTVSKITMDRIVEALRELGNQIEADLAGLYVHASRAYGTAGNTPFATADDLTDLSNIGRILDDNGAPAMGRSMILNNATLAQLQGKQPSVFRVNENGDPMGRRMGAIGMLLNFDIGQSGQFAEHVKGAGSGYLINNAAGEGVGQTELTVDTGAGVVKPGDIITAAGDVNKYVVAVGGNGVTSITIGAPGLREAAANDTELTIGNNYTPNLAFSRDAFHLACRVPAVNDGGDQASDRTVLTDPISGLSYEFTRWPQYRQVSYEVAICWGVAAFNAEHAAILMS